MFRKQVNDKKCYQDIGLDRDLRDVIRMANYQKCDVDGGCLICKITIVNTLTTIL